MVKRPGCCILLLLLCFFTGTAQQYLAGRIIKKGSPDIVPGVNIKNVAAKTYNRSDMGGNYRIAARPGDSIIFSSAGYKIDTSIVTEALLAREMDVYLVPNVVALAAVEIDAMSKYEADSAQRMEDYAYVLNKKHRATIMNKKLQSAPPGFSFSPIAFFSRQEKQKRILVKRIKEEDENEYIDAKFGRSRVAQLTKLTGDSLQQFMLRYRPGYTFCRNASNQDILFYINDKAIAFRKEEDKKNR